MENLGQLLMIGIKSTVLDEEERSFIEKEKIGGIILFKHNYENIVQLASLINDIQKLRDEYPLFISVDHEGGRVQRFRDPFSHFPAMRKLADLASPKKIFEVHHRMGEELLSCGINMSYSPVCDILLNKDCEVIGDRSFGEDAETVSNCVSAAIRGLEDARVLSCAKHFPGHGRVSIDSHFDLPIDETTTKEEWMKEDLLPFIKAVKSRVPFIMMAHLVLKSLDEEKCASFSVKAHNFLREELKYQRIIISDDLEMQAALAHGVGMGQAGVQAIEAGSDMVIVRSFEGSKKVLLALKDAHKKKELSNSKLTMAFKRIEEVKKSYLQDYRPVYIPEMQEFFKKGERKVYLEKIQEEVEKKNQLTSSI